MDPVRSAIEESICTRVFPGAAWSVGSLDCAETGVQGFLTYDVPAAAVSSDTIWDLASLTKVVVTTTLSMVLVNRGELDLDTAVAHYIPAFATNEKRHVTVRNLLLHDSGLPASFPFKPTNSIEAIVGAPLANAVGYKTVYSDVGFLTLGHLIERLMGASLDQLATEHIFDRLGMSATVFHPNPQRCAPTQTPEDWRSKKEMFIQGEVHDPTAASLGGVAGHAGLFSTIDDLVKFAQMLLREGDGLMAPSPFKAFTTQASQASSRALGWDTNWQHASSAGPTWPESAFGHTGFTGTSIWVDPEKRRFAVLLTNRVHPDGADRGIREARLAFHEAASKHFN